MRSFSMSMKINDVLDNPKVKPFAGKIGLNNEAKKGISFNQVIENIPAWQHADMGSGMNRMLELVNNNHSFYCEIYSEAEKNADKSKSDVALYYFPTKERSNAPFVLICPGGAYAGVAVTVEGFPVAAKLNAMGYNAFVLHYRTGTNILEKSKQDLMAALKFIYIHADHLGISINDYSMMGFSAGGHLTSLALTDILDFENAQLAKPKTLILGYPLQDFYQGGGIIKLCKICAFGLLGSRKKVLRSFVPNHILKDAPKVYMWQTIDDDAVPFEANSKVLYKALENAGVTVKYKIVEHGPHGMGIARDSEAEGWIEEAVRFWMD